MRIRLQYFNRSWRVFLFANKSSMLLCHAAMQRNENEILSKVMRARYTMRGWAEKTWRLSQKARQDCFATPLICGCRHAPNFANDCYIGLSSSKFMAFKMEWKLCGKEKHGEQVSISLEQERSRCQGHTGCQCPARPSTWLPGVCRKILGDGKLGAAQAWSGHNEQWKWRMRVKGSE